MNRTRWLLLLTLLPIFSVLPSCDALTGPPRGGVTLVVDVEGAGVGTVRSEPRGIECGTGASSCQGSFPIGTSVTLTATAAAESAFLGWSDFCLDDGPCTLTAGPDLRIGATFERTAAQIGAAGGRLASPDGKLRLEVPPGALAQPTTMTVEMEDPTALGDGFAAIADLLETGTRYELRPEGITFQRPVHISLRLPPPAGTTENRTFLLPVIATSVGGRAAPLERVFVTADLGARRLTLEGEMQAGQSVLIGGSDHLHIEAPYTSRFHVLPQRLNTGPEYQTYIGFLARPAGVRRHTFDHFLTRAPAERSYSPEISSPLQLVSAENDLPLTEVLPGGSTYLVGGLFRFSCAGPGVGRKGGTIDFFSTTKVRHRDSLEYVLEYPTHLRIRLESRSIECA